MIDIIPAEKRYFTDMGWLQTYWLFSFSNYYDPKNTNHGALRVFNDDTVLPGKGFGIHPHKEMEIVSIVLDGEMEHLDTMGNKSIIKKHDVQRMTAGTGLQHSEWNHGAMPVQFFQIWVLPDKPDLAPAYDQKSFNPDSWKDRFVLLAGEGADNGVVRLNTDAKIYRTELSAGTRIAYEPVEGRSLFFYIVNGSALINESKLENRYQARISQEREIELQGLSQTDILLIDVPSREN